MSYKLKDVVYENGKHWVLRVTGGFEVYKINSTHSTRCAVIGWKGEEGLSRAIAEADRRQSNG